MQRHSTKAKMTAHAGAGIALTAALMVWSAPYAFAAEPTPPANAPGSERLNDAPKDRMNMRERFRARMDERMQERRGARNDERGVERRAQIDRKLTTDQVRDIVEGRLALSGNANLKVGKVTAKEEGVVAVDIVTKTGALVETREISTRTGHSVQAERLRADRGRGFGRGPGRGAGPERDLKLTTDQVRKLAEARLIMRANPNLKVGAVREKDADTITVDIVAADNSLVVQQEINRRNGRPRRGA